MTVLMQSPTTQFSPAVLSLTEPSRAMEVYDEYIFEWRQWPKWQ
jgi:hypothetical protein